MEPKQVLIRKPKGMTDEHLKYLDALRLSGVTNMYGAGPYLVREFSMTRIESHQILAYWMKSFSERHS